MKRKLRILYRISSLVLTLLMLVGALSAIPLSAEGENEVTKTEKSYDIAVVFDNSGSMYLPDDNGDTWAWSRAKYAMEIFASMLDYSKDKLTVFPMWEVTTDGTTPKPGSQANKSTEPIEITKQEDINQLSKMYTICAAGTPFTTVTSAHSYLQNSKKDEKWLIVLTDGEFDEFGKDEKKLKESLLEKANNGIKVQYLGFGDAPSLASDVDNGFYTPSSSATTLETKLIETCNTIFQRSVLPSNRLSGKDLNLDLSMKKLIVFVQGQGASINSLSDSSGKSIGVTLDSKQRKYSDVKYSAGNYVGKCDTDESLYGQVVTFEACAKGTYKLDYTGSQDAIQIFYEPDVKIDVTFTNSDGQVVDNADDFYAGEYTVNSKIVDSSTGEDVTNHELMGNDVKIVTKVKTSQDSDYKEYENGSKITFAPDSNTEILIEGEYLGKYKIRSDENPELDWFKNIKVQDPPAEFLAKATVLQDGNWYKIKDHENWKPVRVSLTLEGQPLTDEQLARTKLSISTSGDLKYRYEAVPGESAYNVYIAQDENGKYIEPATGKYELKATATYTDEYGKETDAKETKATFEVQSYDKWIKILIISVIVILILALIVAWLIHPVLPKYATVRHSNPNIYENSINVDSSFGIPGWRDYTQMILSGTPKPIFGKNNSWFNAVLCRRRSEQTFRLENISVSNITSLNIDGEPGKITNGKWCDASGDEITSVVIGNESSIRWSEQDRGKIAPFNGTIEIS